LIKETEVNIDNFDFGVYVQKVYDFVWNEFCDWYIEIVKTRLYNEYCQTRNSAKYTLNKVLSESLKLLHPVIPFVTEEIYLSLYNNDESIMISKWPEYNEKFEFSDEENQIEKLKDIITEIRNVRTKMNVHPTKKSKLIFVTKKYKDILEKSEGFLLKLGFADRLEIIETKENVSQNAISIVQKDLELFIPFEDLVDLAAEKERLILEKNKLESEVDRAKKMLSNPGFVNKAPESKIAEEKEKLSSYEQMLNSVNERLKNM
jgi:valyl-tRNA synthetase